MMKVITYDNDIEEEFRHLELLNTQIREDMKNNDERSLRYHLIALDTHIKKLKSLTVDKEKTNEDL